MHKNALSFKYQLQKDTSTFFYGTNCEFWDFEKYLVSFLGRSDATTMKIVRQYFSGFLKMSNTIRSNILILL